MKYIESVKQAVNEYLADNEYFINMADFQDADDFSEWLNDRLWTEDSVTGNASGSYFCNSYRAKEAVLEDMDTVREALQEFGTPAEEIGERFLNEDWEWLDVTARCYVLGQAISEYIEENETEVNQAIAEANEQ